MSITVNAHRAPSELPPPLVMVLDDDPDVRAVLAEVLGGSGARVVTAPDVRAAAAALEPEQPPALIVLDIVLPEMNGWRFLQLLRQTPEYRDVPVLAISGADVVPPAGLHPVPILTKPLDVDEVTAVVDRLLRPVPQPSLTSLHGSDTLASALPDRLAVQPRPGWHDR